MDLRPSRPPRLHPHLSPVETEQSQLDGMIRQVRRAARVPFPAQARLERLLAALFDHTLTHPATYRLLRDDAGPATAARTGLTAEVAGLLASSGPANEVAAASVGVVGFALANIGLCLSGVLDAEHAWRVTCEFCTCQLEK